MLAQRLEQIIEWCAILGANVDLCAALEQWPPEIIGPDLGYLSQAVDLFDGTVAENIARMAVEPNDGAVVRAATAAGAHEMILRLPARRDGCR